MDAVWLNFYDIATICLTSLPTSINRNCICLQILNVFGHLLQIFTLNRILPYPFISQSKLGKSDSIASVVILFALKTKSGIRVGVVSLDVGDATFTNT